MKKKRTLIIFVVLISLISGILIAEDFNKLDADVEIINSSDNLEYGNINHMEIMVKNNEEFDIKPVFSVITGKDHYYKKWEIKGNENSLRPNETRTYEIKPLKNKYTYGIDSNTDYQLIMSTKSSTDITSTNTYRSKRLRNQIGNPNFLKITQGSRMWFSSGKNVKFGEGFVNMESEGNFTFVSQPISFSNLKVKMNTCCFSKEGDIGSANVAIFDEGRKIDFIPHNKSENKTVIPDNYNYDRYFPYEANQNKTLKINISEIYETMNWTKPPEKNPGYLENKKGLDIQLTVEAKDQERVNATFYSVESLK